MCDVLLVLITSLDIGYVRTCSLILLWWTNFFPGLTFITESACGRDASRCWLVESCMLAEPLSTNLSRMSSWGTEPNVWRIRPRWASFWLSWLCPGLYRQYWDQGENTHFICYFVIIFTQLIFYIHAGLRHLQIRVRERISFTRLEMPSTYSISDDFLTLSFLIWCTGRPVSSMCQEGSESFVSNRSWCSGGSHSYPHCRPEGVVKWSSLTICESLSKSRSASLILILERNW